ncbi:MAG: glycosyl hydrolase 53 family protein [Verrucomicrobiota bacterium]
MNPKLFAAWTWICLAACGASAATNTCTFQVDMSVQTALGNFNPSRDKVGISGTWNNWGTTTLLSARVDNTNIYAITCLLTNGVTAQYKFIINSNNTGTILWENYWGVANSYNRSVTMPPSGGASVGTLFYNNQSNAAPGFPFMVAADFSHLQFFLDRGVVYRDAGQPADALALLKNRGITAARLRLFTGTDAQVKTNVAYNYTNNLSYNLPLAARVKQAGLQLILDFHFSDTWADPGHQAVPVSWTNGLTYASLLTKMRSYTSNCLAAFQATNAMPDYVQIGNEITGGMLWPYGKVGGSTNFGQLSALISSAVQGISDVAGSHMPKIIIHIDRGGDWGSTQWFFDNLRTSNVPCDIIGESYYPFWHGSWTNDLPICVTNAIKRYDKPVMIMETAFPWNNSHWTTNIYGIAPGTNGQVQFLTSLVRVLTNSPCGMGAGVVWWGAEYQAVSGVNEAGFNTASFFDSSGNILPVAAAFGAMAPTPSLNNLAVNVSATWNNTNLTLAGTVQKSWPTNAVTGPAFPSIGEPVLVTVNGITQTGAVTSATGDFSVNFNLSALPYGIGYPVTYSYPGSGSLNPTIDSSTTLSWSRAAVAVTNLVVPDKVYDGSALASIDASAAGLDGAIPGDDVTLNVTGASALFADADPGTAKPVTVSGCNLSGSDSGNYILVQPAGLAASILPLIEPLLSGPAMLGGSTGQITFSGQEGQNYRLLGTDSLAVPLAQWTVLTNGTFGPDPVIWNFDTTNSAQQFFRVLSP